MRINIEEKFGINSNHTTEQQSITNQEREIGKGKTRNMMCFQLIAILPPKIHDSCVVCSTYTYTYYVPISQLKTETITD